MNILVKPQTLDSLLDPVIERVEDGGYQMSFEDFVEWADANLEPLLDSERFC